MIIWQYFGRQQEHTVRSQCQVAMFLSDFNQIWTSSTNFHRVSNINFHGNPSSGSRADICGETDGREEGNKRSSRLCERV